MDPKNNIVVKVAGITLGIIGAAIILALAILILLLIIKGMMTVWTFIF